MNKYSIYNCITGLRRTVALIAAVILIIAGITPRMIAQAANHTGTLTIQPREGDTLLNYNSYQGSFNIYHVADYDATGAGTFTLTEPFKDYDTTEITGDALSASEAAFKQIAQELYAYLNAHSSSIDPIWSGAHAGDTRTLPYGLFLVTQNESMKHYSDCTPFLVMIPMYGENTTETNVIAYPKVTSHDHPHGDENPPTPPQYGRIALAKVDTDDNTIVLPGVTFNLYKVGQEDAIGTYVTDSNGLIYIDNLPVGDYYLKETATIDGYILNDQPWNITVVANETSKLVVTNTKQPIPEETPHGYTGDDSNMLLYGAVTIIAASMLVTWIIWKRKLR